MRMLISTWLSTLFWQKTLIMLLIAESVSCIPSVSYNTVSPLIFAATLAANIVRKHWQQTPTTQMFNYEYEATFHYFNCKYGDWQADVLSKEFRIGHEVTPTMALVNEMIYLPVLRTIICLSTLMICGVNGAGSVTDVTSQVGLSSIDGVIAAFCDFDSDRDTDILVLGSKGKHLNIYLWSVHKQQFELSDKGLKFSDNTLLVGVAHSDFDGDGCPDVLVVTKNETYQKVVSTYVYWNVGERLDIKYRTFVGVMKDQPLIIDANGDLLPDLLGIDYTTGFLTTWLSGSASLSRTFRTEIKDNTTILAPFPVTSGFVDLDGDFHSDLFLPVISGNRLTLQVWKTKGGLFKDQSNFVEITLPSEMRNKKFGQPSFGDMDADGMIDIILPVCDLPRCTVPAIYMFCRNTSLKLFAAQDAEHSIWRFPDDDFKASNLLNFPPVLRIGDFTMDGYPDAVAVFEGRGSNRIAFLLENVECDNRDSSCYGPRALKIKTQMDKDAVVISFFDLYENGILDFLVVKNGSDGELSIKAYRNDFNTDTTFLKITVLSGRCYKECICKKIETPYGANQVGAAVAYQTVSTEGKIQRCAATQLSQSSHFALQLPYTLFGLGRSPNFVDKVEVGIPQSTGKVDRTHSWPSLIPNSQVIVIPFPPDRPHDWMTKLLVTPSKLLLQTGGVLVGTCVFVAALILMLHIKEKREDEKEKRQEAHKFHFDAL